MMQQPMRVGAPIDEVLASVRAGQTPPADERQWIVVEIVDGKLTWTTHNVALDDAFKHLSLCALDVRDEMQRTQPHTH